MLRSKGLHALLQPFPETEVFSWFTQVFKYLRLFSLCSVPKLCPTLWPHGLQPVRLLHPWDSPGKNTGVGFHFLPQGIFLTQESNPHLLHKSRFFTTEPPGNPCFHDLFFKIFIYLAVLGLSCGLWDLVPWPGIKPGPPTSWAWSLSL